VEAVEDADAFNGQVITAFGEQAQLGGVVFGANGT
jgi:hypothetical protein